MFINRGCLQLRRYLPPLLTVHVFWRSRVKVKVFKACPGPANLLVFDWMNLHFKRFCRAIEKMKEWQYQEPTWISHCLHIFYQRYQFVFQAMTVREHSYHSNINSKSQFTRSLFRESSTYFLRKETSSEKSVQYSVNSTFFKLGKHSCVQRWKRS